MLIKLAKIKMKKNSPFIFALIAPFNPKWSFKKIEPIENKKSIGVTVFIFCFLITTLAYTIGQLKNSGYTQLNLFLNILGFSAGLILKQIFTLYILLIFLKRYQKTKINWQEILCVISFALIPLFLSNLLQIIKPQASQIGQIICSFWNFLIIISGLFILKKIPVWKSGIFLLTIILLFEVIKLTFLGIEI